MVRVGSRRSNLGSSSRRSRPAGSSKLLGLDLCSSSPDTSRERIERRDGLLPRETRVRDRHSVLESTRSVRSDRLLALLEVGLDHDTHDLVGGRSGRELGGDVLGDDDLVLVLLGRVAVRAVDHDLLDEPGLGELGRDLLDVLGGVVGALVGPSEDDVRRLVPAGLDDGRETLLGDREEGVASGGSPDGVDGDVDRSVLRKERRKEARGQSQSKEDREKDAVGLTVPFLNPTAMLNADASSR